MKKLIILMILTLLAALAIDLRAANPVDDFVELYRNRDGGFHLDLGTSFLEDDDAERDLLERVDKVRIFSMDKEAFGEKNKELKKFKKKLKKDGFESYVKMKDGDSDIELLAKSRKEAISNWLMLVDGEDSYFLLEIEGSFFEKDVERIGKKLDMEQSKFMKN